MLFVVAHDIPVRDDIFEDYLSYILSETLWEVSQNRLLPNTPEVIPEDLVKVYHSVFEVHGDVIEITVSFDSLHFLGVF